MDNTHIIAHRGYSSIAPENTLPAFSHAINAKVDAIEFDIRMTRDGRFVVFHDETLERITNGKSKERIEDMTYAELQKHEVGSWFEKMYHGTHIPTLEEVLHLARGGIGLMIEIKKTPYSHKDFITKLLDILLRFEIVGPIWLGSFEHDIIEECRSQKCPWPLIGIVEKEEALHRFIQMKISHVAVDHAILSPYTVKELNSKGLKIWAWTVDDPLIAHTLKEHNVHGIISNNPKAILDDKTTA
jgi:glycerophosphoryl diester phosphodiesterase